MQQLVYRLKVVPATMYHTLLDSLLVFQCLGVRVDEIHEGSAGGPEDMATMEGLVRLRGCAIITTFGTAINDLDGEWGWQ